VADIINQEKQCSEFVTNRPNNKLTRLFLQTAQFQDLYENLY